MNNFEFRPDVESKEQSILNDWDKEILLKGAKNVVDKILKEFGDKLPDGIIYPDTSARPLFYLFDPILSKISKEKNVPKPQSYFMKTKRTDTDTTIFEDSEERELSFDEIKEKFNKQIQFHEEMMKSPYPEELMKYRTKNIEETNKSRIIAKERASEINSYNKKLRSNGVDTNLVIIDEFSDTGQTSKEIQYAFSKDIPYFSIFGFDSENHLPQENIGVLVDREQYIENPTTNNHTKLSYTAEAFRRSIGVNKHNDTVDKYSEVNKNQTLEDKEMMKTLRNEMKELGEQIVKEY